MRRSVVLLGLALIGLSGCDSSSKSSSSGTADQKGPGKAPILEETAPPRAEPSPLATLSNPLPKERRCQARFARLTEEQRNAFAERFAARNPGWKIIAKSFVGHVHRGRKEGVEGPTIGLTAETAEAKVREFVGKNLDFFTLRPEELPLLEAEAKEWDDEWSVALRGKLPMLGYEQYRVSRVLSLVFRVHQSGQVTKVSSRSVVYPVFDICMDARLAAADERLRAPLVGMPLAYIDSNGKRGSAGVVELDRLGSPKLTIHKHNVATDDGELWVFDLAYQVDLKRHSGWTGYLDPDTGHILDIETALSGATPVIPTAAPDAK